MNSSEASHSTPMPELPIQRPSLTLLGFEPWRAAFEFASHKLGRKDDPVALGDGHPVIIFPGMASDGTATAPLRHHCESLGYRAFDWGRGFNTGPQGNIDTWLAELAAHTARMLAPFGQSATLIGWSLGGLYAREVAKLLGPKVRQVITIGTPFNASADHTNVGWIFRLLNGASPASRARGADHLHLQPLRRRGGMADLPARRCLARCARRRSARQPHRTGLEPCGVARGGRPARATARALATLRGGGHCCCRQRQAGLSGSG
jgi:pimeloyl-ACP methyl ester carboxylesterase